MRDGAREESIKWESDLGEWVGEANQRFVVEGYGCPPTRGLPGRWRRAEAATMTTTSSGEVDGQKAG